MFPIKEVDRLSEAFATTVKGFLPEMKDIPEEFKNRNTPWNDIVSQMFYAGGTIKKAVPKAGVDADKAMKHIYYCLSSWEPKHERKMAGTAFLLSEWFDEFEFEPNPMKPIGGK